LAENIIKKGASGLAVLLLKFVNCSFVSLVVAIDVAALTREWIKNKRG
jgi:hypothetical protein